MHSDLKVLSAIQAPEYISSINAEHAEILAKIAAKASQKVAKKEPGKPEINPQWNEKNLLEYLVLAEEPKIKVKTRSEKLAKECDYSVKAPVLTDQHVELSQIKFGVGKRTLEILQSLFPKSNFEERRKSVDWASFVQAMGDIWICGKTVSSISAILQSGFIRRYINFSHDHILNIFLGRNTRKRLC